MIQFNLLPDVKKQYIKARQTKQVITTVAIVASIASLVVTGVLFSIVQFGQKKHITDLTTDIAAGITRINQVEDVNKILTVQNQLNSLQGLHATKPEASRIFDYLSQITPQQAKVSSVNLDFKSYTIKLDGKADSLSTVNQFADTLKFAEFTSESKVTDGSAVPGEATPKAKVFSAVATQLSRSSDGASYSISATYDPALFDNTKKVTITIPAGVTTRSVIGAPDLFDQNSQTEGQQ